MCPGFLVDTDVCQRWRCRTLIIRLISTAQTGFFYTTQRLRLGPRLSAVKYDPVGAFVVHSFVDLPVNESVNSEAESIVC